MDFWEIVLLLIGGAVVLAYLILLVEVVRDLLRDPELSGWSKAAWLVALIWLPVLTSLVYVVARGGRTAIRLYRETTSGSDTGPSPTQEIAQAKSMWDTGVIDKAEFDALKLKALS
jgi:hypothetical protein